MIDSFQGKYRFLSNFWPAEVTFEGQNYPTVENAFQAAKSCDLNERHGFQYIAPGQAKRLGRSVTLRDDWESIKVGVMYRLVEEKFTRHNLMREWLLETGDEYLVEGNTWNDRFWGVCRGEGKNHLGIILMSVRDKLRGA